jgi:hypothetical protein
MKMKVYFSGVTKENQKRLNHDTDVLAEIQTTHLRIQGRSVAIWASLFGMKA